MRIYLDIDLPFLTLFLVCGGVGMVARENLATFANSLTLPLNRKRKHKILSASFYYQLLLALDNLYSKMAYSTLV